MNNKKSCRLSSTCYFVRLNAYTNVYTLLYVEKRVKLNPRTTDCSLSELIILFGYYVVCFIQVALNRGHSSVQVYCTPVELPISEKRLKWLPSSPLTNFETWQVNQENSDEKSPQLLYFKN